MTTAAPAKQLTFEIVFDGGSLGNPGKGYGSYEITHRGEVLRRFRHDYGDNVTNNQAEYQTLIEALKWLAEDLGANSKLAQVQVNGDSLLVINQLTGKWKVKHEGIRPLVQNALAEIKKFGNVKLTWHDRSNSVKRLGHKVRAGAMACPDRRLTPRPLCPQKKRESCRKDHHGESQRNNPEKPEKHTTHYKEDERNNQRK